MMYVHYVVCYAVFKRSFLTQNDSFCQLFADIFVVMCIKKPLQIQDCDTLLYLSGGKKEKAIASEDGLIVEEIKNGKL